MKKMDVFKEYNGRKNLRIKNLFDEKYGTMFDKTKYTFFNKQLKRLRFKNSQKIKQLLSNFSASIYESC